MENFILWNVSYSQKTQELSFFATSLQIKKINKGTEDMLNEMIQDLQLGTISYQNWEIKHFLTNYLMDFPPSDDWRDVWMDTWQIKLSLEEAIKIELKPLELIRSYARDKTWKGEYLSFPTECLIVADFSNNENLLEAKKILETINDSSNKYLSLEKFQEIPKNIIQNFLNELRKNYVQPNNFQKISIEQKNNSINQLIISLGFVNEDFFVGGAKLAQKTSELIKQLDGTTTWDETTDKLYLP